MPKDPIISARIITLVASGVDLFDAIDQVLGEGTSTALVSDLYHGLRARSGKESAT